MASESEISAASQESGYNTMAAPNTQRVDSMPVPIPRTSSTGGITKLHFSIVVRQSTEVIGYRDYIVI